MDWTPLKKKSESRSESGLLSEIWTFEKHSLERLAHGKGTVLDWSLMPLEVGAAVCTVGTVGAIAGAAIRDAALTAFGASSIIAGVESLLPGAVLTEVAVKEGAKKDK